MADRERRVVRAVLRQAVVLLGIYVLIAWTVFLHDGSETGWARFWPPGDVYRSFQAAGHTGVFAFPLFVFAYAFPVLSVIDLMRVWRKVRADGVEGAR